MLIEFDSELILLYIKKVLYFAIYLVISVFLATHGFAVHYSHPGEGCGNS